MSTASFRLALPHLLLPLHPSLAALHATRAHRLHPSSIHSTHCKFCGAFLLNGDGETRIRRLKRLRTNASTAALLHRVLQRSCHICGYRQHTPLERGNASLFPSRSRRHRVVPATEEQHRVVTPVHEQAPFHPPEFTSSFFPSPDSPLPATTPRPKNRPKKKSGLRNMLLRNREKEEKDRSAMQSGAGALATFLDGL